MRRATLTTTSRDADLEALAADLDVVIREHEGGKKGYYYHGARPRTITLRSGLTPRQYRSTLAHELAHAYYGDEPTGDPVLDARIERRADIAAAELLITPEDYRLAETIHGPHIDALACELGVTSHMVRVWRDIQERKPHGYFVCV